MHNKKEKLDRIVYIVAGTGFILLALLLLFFLIRGAAVKKKGKTEPPAPAQTVVQTENTVPNGITVAGKVVSADGDSFDLTGGTLTAEDVAALASMPNLTTLSLSGCSLSDLTPLSALTGLRTLYLPDNRITDLTPLMNLTNLKTLYLDRNPLTDLTPLTALPNLTTLSIQGVTVADYVLEDLKSTMPNCRVFSDSAVETVRPISLGGMAFTEDVDSLDLSNRGISDISRLSYCMKLETLNLSGNPLGSITTLSSLPKLRRLDLSAAGLDDSAIPQLRLMQKLEWINLSGNSFTAEGLDSLKSALSRCEIVHDAVYYRVTLGSRELTSDMEDVDLTYCAVESIAGLEKFTVLRRLVLRGNGVEDLMPLQSITTLEEVDISENRVSQLGALSNHGALRTLRAGHNNISDIYALASCPALEELDLSYNHIPYLTHLTSCTRLRRVDLTGNPELTADQVLMLKAALPNCEIITDIPLTAPEEAAPPAESWAYTG